jgi:hypothetical protein
LNDTCPSVANTSSAALITPDLVWHYAYGKWQGTMEMHDCLSRVFRLFGIDPSISLLEHHEIDKMLYVNATQSNVQLSAFGGTLAASRVTNIDYNNLINKPAIVLPGYLSPVALTSNIQELSGLLSGNGIYAYTSSVSLDFGFCLFRLSGFAQEVRFNNVWNIVTTLTLPILASIAKYAIRAGGAATFPSDFSVLFFDVNNL